MTAFDVHLLSQCHHALILPTHREPWLSWLSIRKSYLTSRTCPGMYNVILIPVAKNPASVLNYPSATEQHTGLSSFRLLAIRLSAL